MNLHWGGWPGVNGAAYIPIPLVVYGDGSIPIGALCLDELPGSGAGDERTPGAGATRTRGAWRFILASS